MLNVDPNEMIGICKAYKTWKLVFGMWTYRKEITVTVCENRGGLDSLNFAIETAYEGLSPEGSITLQGPKGLLECTDEDGQFEEFLEDMLVSAELVAVKPAGNAFAPHPEKLERAT